MKSPIQQHGSKYFAYRPPPPSDAGGRSNGHNQAFQNITVLHIKFNGITNTAKW